MQTRTPADRQRAERIGRLAELLALVYLVVTGHRILARRFRSTSGEIDLIARRGSKIIFCEVKFRHSADHVGLPSAQQCRRICRAAREFISQRRIPPGFECRIDLIRISRLSLRGGWPISHLRNAWWCDHA